MAHINARQRLIDLARERVRQCRFFQREDS
jgi:hypothetical protein